MLDLAPPRISAPLLPTLTQQGYASKWLSCDNVEHDYIVESILYIIVLYDLENIASDL